MEVESFNLKILLILAMGFGYASVLGYIAQRIHLSPIVGYLIAGYLIGPYSPGFVADMQLAEQLAEIGVVLMMFGVGLHFKWQDLVSAKDIAILGAVIQTTVTTLIVIALTYFIGWTLEAGIVLGIALGVASTVVLVHLLLDSHLLNTPEGHIAIGWLIVEDIITVIALLLVPSLVLLADGGQFSFVKIAGSVALAILKCFAISAFMFTMGAYIISYLLKKVSSVKSRELMTLTILALIFAVAVGSSELFGTSIALGAFIAGMTMAQATSHQLIFKSTLPLQDAFVVLFFISIGMLFDPAIMYSEYFLIVSVLGIIFFVKPLVAYLTVRALKRPVFVAATVAVALAQIGEFSFIVAEEASRYQLIPDAAYDVIVAAALITIAVNPLLLKLVSKKKRALTEKGK